MRTVGWIILHQGQPTIVGVDNHRNMNVLAWRTPGSSKATVYQTRDAAKKIVKRSKEIFIDDQQGWKIVRLESEQ